MATQQSIEEMDQVHIRITKAQKQRLLALKAQGFNQAALLRRFLAEGLAQMEVKA